MRGKLRDKRADLKRDNLKRDVAARRRPFKRDNRNNMIWLNDQFDGENNDPSDGEAELLVKQVQK